MYTFTVGQRILSLCREGIRSIHQCMSVEGIIINESAEFSRGVSLPNLWDHIPKHLLLGENLRKTHYVLDNFYHMM